MNDEMKTFFTYTVAEAIADGMLKEIPGLKINVKKPLFELGQVVATPGAMQALEENDEYGIKYLSRHRSGDWGDLDQADKAENKRSVKEGFRILSAYKLPDGQKLWVITEADRSVTTLLLPSEY